MREITDKEAADHFKRTVIDAIKAEGKDPNKLKIVRLYTTGQVVITAAQLHDHVKNILKGIPDAIGREELEKQKRWMQYKIKRGWMK